MTGSYYLRSWARLKTVHKHSAFSTAVSCKTSDSRVCSKAPTTHILLVEVLHVGHDAGLWATHVQDGGRWWRRSAAAVQLPSLQHLPQGSRPCQMPEIPKLDQGRAGEFHFADRRQHAVEMFKWTRQIWQLLVQQQRQ